MRSDPGNPLEGKEGGIARRQFFENYNSSLWLRKSKGYELTCGGLRALTGDLDEQENEVILIVDVYLGICW